MSIVEKISRGESRTLEFKRELPKGSILAKTVIAFANGAGGDIIIGVDKEGDVVGIPQDEIFELQDKVSNIVYDSCSPVIIPKLFFEKINDKLVLVIRVFSGSLKPYYLKSESRLSGIYIRIGATNKRADVPIIQQLEREKQNLSFDAEINYYPNSKPDLSFLSTLYNKNINGPILKNLKLLIEETGKEFYTNAAFIITGLFENSFVNCARFKGNTTEVFIDHKEYKGNIFDQLDNVEMFLKNHLMLSGRINGFVREDSLEIPMAALREAIINAFVHRDYSILGSNIKIAIFDDEVKISSPGVLPSSISIEHILDEERSEIRNPILARIFKELNYIEQWGSGFSKIKNACLLSGLALPAIRESGSFFQVIFKRPQYDEIVSGGKVAEKWRKDGGKVAETDREKVVINFIEANERIRTSDVENLFGVKVSRARLILSEMVKKNMLLKIGKSKNTYYTHNKANY